MIIDVARVNGFDPNGIAQQVFRYHNWNLLKHALTWNAEWHAAPVFDESSVYLKQDEYWYRFCEDEEQSSDTGLVFGPFGTSLLVSTSPQRQRQKVATIGAELLGWWEDERPLLIHDHDGYLMVLFHDLNEVLEENIHRLARRWEELGGTGTFCYSICAPLRRQYKSAPLEPRWLPRKALELVTSLFQWRDGNGDQWPMPEYSWDPSEAVVRCADSDAVSGAEMTGQG